MLVCMPVWQAELHCKCSLGLVCQREVDGDNVTFLDEVIKLSKAAAQLLLLWLIQMLVVKVQHLLASKALQPIA